jgi:hypothetical protein
LFTAPAERVTVIFGGGLAGGEPVLVYGILQAALIPSELIIKVELFDRSPAEEQERFDRIKHRRVREEAYWQAYQEKIDALADAAARAVANS